MKVLITGGSGKLGKELVKIFPESLHPTRQELELKVKVQVDNYISEKKPDVIIHTGAVTSIPFCEENRKEAYETNVAGTENLVNACIDHSAKCYFVLISTACVFRGDVGDYVETDLPYPKNYYALTKLLAEFVVKRSGLKFLIIRTNFVARMKWPYPRAFVDRYGTYLFASDVASAVKSVIQQKLTGIVHVRGEEKMSMFELAKITTPTIEPMTLAEYHGVPLTVDMSLSSVRLKPFKISR
ncbi:dTDP-4-dehydrorhamnose reductase [Candidatus Bathyarchaeota archaeon RBG_13_46_16b]|nr:MAG: dTDP-4-dehydrorhamnose reductase [Candidatus Bathyarchaeota archaeon RBG_13_46_16b]